jgi:hypothetical protein
MAAERPDDLAREGLEHLQAAAREVIKATRSLLDAAEQLVDDPAAVQQAVGALTGLAQVAAARLRAGGGDAAPSEGDEPGDTGRVERIRIS